MLDVFHCFSILSSDAYVVVCMLHWPDTYLQRDSQIPMVSLQSLKHHSFVAGRVMWLIPMAMLRCALPSATARIGREDSTAICLASDVGGVFVYFVSKSFHPFIAFGCLFVLQSASMLFHPVNVGFIQSGVTVSNPLRFTYSISCLGADTNIYKWQRRYITADRSFVQHTQTVQTDKNDAGKRQLAKLVDLYCLQYS